LFEGKIHTEQDINGQEFDDEIYLELGISKAEFEPRRCEFVRDLSELFELPAHYISRRLVITHVLRRQKHN